MQALLSLIAVLLAGIGVAVQTPTNAMLARVSGSVVLAALVSFSVGTVLLIAAWFATGARVTGELRTAPWWAWLGGLYGACFVVALAYAVPRLGLAVTLTAAIASQLATALLLDHFGLLGLARAPVSPVRLAGVALVVAGVVLVRRG